MTITTKPFDFRCSTPGKDPQTISSMRARWAAESYVKQLIHSPKNGEAVRVDVVGEGGYVYMFDVVAEVHDPSWRAREVKLAPQADPLGHTVKAETLEQARALAQRWVEFGLLDGRAPPESLDGREWPALLAWVRQRSQAAADERPNADRVARKLAATLSVSEDLGITNVAAHTLCELAGWPC